MNEEKRKELLSDEYLSKQESPEDVSPVKPIEEGEIPDEKLDQVAGGISRISKCATNEIE